MRVVILMSIVALLVLPACQEDGSENDDKIAQELRFFDLYMGATFKDTIAPPTESGLYYIEITPGTGKSPGENDWILINHVAYTIPDNYVVDTYIENVASTSGIPTNVALFGPFKMQNGAGAEGFTEGLTMMREGGSAIMCFTSDLGFGSSGTQLMRSVGEFKSMKYEVELLKVIGEDIEGYEQNRIEAYQDTIVGVKTLYDSLSETTMYYVVDEPNLEGSQITTDSVVEIAYKGYLIDGRVFDESAEDSPYEFKVGDYSAETSPIEGWHLGVTAFREGEKGRLIIPYALAYGELGNVVDNQVSIPPYETLVFNIEVVSVNDSSGDKDPEVVE